MEYLMHTQLEADSNSGGHTVSVWVRRAASADPEVAALRAAAHEAKSPHSTSDTIKRAADEARRMAADPEWELITRQMPPGTTNFSVDFDGNQQVVVKFG